MERNEELLKRTEIKDTPFMVITSPEGSFGVLGSFRITELKKSETEVIKELKEINWNRIVQIVLVLIQQMDDQKFNNKLKCGS
jgi:hypothetical protein